MAKETNNIPELEKKFRISKFWEEKILEKSLLLLLVSMAIGYLLTPKLIFQPTEYNEGDVFRQTIAVEEDMLVPDHVSTRLKKENLLKEMGTVYDFDPNVREGLRDKISKAFQKVRKKYDSFEVELKKSNEKKRFLGKNYFLKSAEQQLIHKKIGFYERYKSVLEKQLEGFSREEKLSSRGFNQKKTLDTKLNSVNLILNDAYERGRLLAKELEKFSEDFRLREEEDFNLRKSIESRKNVTIQDFIKDLRMEVSKSELDTFSFAFYTPEIEEQLYSFLGQLQGKRIVSSKLHLRVGESSVLEIRDLVSGEVSKITHLKSIYDLDDLRTITKKMVTESMRNSGDIQKNFLIFLVQQMIRPTLTENKQELEIRKETLLAEMSPVFFSLKKGEIIARAGDRATRHQIEVIRGYYAEIANTDKLPKFLGSILIVLLSLTLVYFSFQLSETSKLTFKNILLIGTAIVITMLLVKSGMFVGEIVETQYLGIQGQVYRYLLPVALGSMLVSILVNFEAALMAGLLTSLFVSVMMQGNLYYFTFAMMGSLIGALPIRNFDSRYSILKHGLMISLVNMPIVFVVFLIEKNSVDLLNWPYFSAALIGGIMTAILVSVLLPFFESLFDVTTSLKLLELSNMNHPALKDLIFNAPGSYQHSILVGNLSEAAAREIGANPLLARVGSYYHDIGKGFKSQYFIENQPQNSKNVHDEMDPLLSARSIIEHVEKGAEIAEKHRLGRAIIDILMQHHGDGLVKFFYHKACQLAEKNGEPRESVDPKQFQYPGPKPQTLEAALVMLADATEAATRSIKNPTPDSISAMVHKVGWAILEEGQLDESGLTLRKFRKALDVFCNVLTSIHHHRIKYPSKVTTDYLNASSYR